MATTRQLSILQCLTMNGRVAVHDLAELLHVSASTVRRELAIMELGGMVIRSHGSAQLTKPIQYEPGYENRAAQQILAKRMIAMAAKKMVKPGMVIGLAGGTTCTELARLLRPVENITVVTNALNIPLELQGQLNKQVMVTGGMQKNNSYELIGTQAIHNLQEVHTSIVFMGATGISFEYGICIDDKSEAAVARAFMESTSQSIILADHTKIGNATFARLCLLTEPDLLITDPGITDKQHQLLEEAGLRVLVAMPIG